MRTYTLMRFISGIESNCTISFAYTVVKTINTPNTHKIIYVLCFHQRFSMLQMRCSMFAYMSCVVKVKRGKKCYVGMRYNFIE